MAQNAYPDLQQAPKALSTGATPSPAPLHGNSSNALSKPATSLSDEPAAQKDVFNSSQAPVNGQSVAIVGGPQGTLDSLPPSPSSDGALSWPAIAGVYLSTG
jgi:hypothetical protein